MAEVGWKQNLKDETLYKWFTEVKLSGEAYGRWGSELVLGEERSTEVAGLSI